MNCPNCDHVIPTTSRYCAYCGHPQVAVLAVCELVAESVSEEGATMVQTADALMSEYVMRLRAKHLIAGHPAADVRSYSVAEATGVLYETAKDVVRKGYDAVLVSSVAGRMAEGMFYDRLKRESADVSPRVIGGLGVKYE